jgi:cytochrome c biogenesis protein CcmG, thiol:disulfide interchange protein DsbE
VTSKGRIVAVVVIAGLCAGLVWVLGRGFGQNPHAVPFNLQGKPAPAFTLKSLDGAEEYSLEKLRGKAVVINFWATWCQPCKLEHPVLDWGANELKEQAVFLGVINGDTEENARAFIQKYGSAYPQLVDPNSSMSVDYGIAGVPETYFIDKAGIIRHKHIGPIDPQTLVAQVRALQ